MDNSNSTGFFPVVQEQSHNAQATHNSILSDTSYHLTNQSSSSVLAKSFKISPCQPTMWSLHRMIVVVTLWIMCCCSSEAFASRSNNSFFGRKLGNVGFFRGGSSSASSTASGTTTTKSSSDSSTSTLTCVMQAPPRVTSTINGEFSNDDNQYNEKKRNNGSKQPPAAISNSAAFFRPQRQRVLMDDDLSKDTKALYSNIPAQDVITAAVHVAETKLPTDIGQFQLRAYRIEDSNGNNSKDSPMGQQEPCVIYSRDKPPFGNATHFAQHVPVRIHDQCLTSEVFGSQRYVHAIVDWYTVLWYCYCHFSPLLIWTSDATVKSSCTWHYNT